MDEASKFLVSHKVKTPEELAGLLGAQPRDRKVIMCHGTFDIVHPGHVRHLLYAKSKADVLVASLTADAHIKKANFRPFVPQELRAVNLAALEVVDYVVIDVNETPLENIRIIKPDYFAKGYEYTQDGLPPRTAEEKAAVDSYGGELIFTPGDIVYSSSRLIESAPPSIPIEKLMALLDAEGLSLTDIRQALDQLRDVKVHVLGDTIVDSYTRCSMIGGMTKTPTMSVRFDERDDYVGGAGVLAKHLKAAGAEVTFSTVLGKDALAEYVLEDLAATGIDCRAVADPTRPTTHKDSIIAGDYNLLKVDTVDNRSISDVVLFSDFRHGIFNRETIPQLSDAVPSGVFRVADSQVASRWGNILEFEKFDLIAANEREARFALADQDSVVRPLGLELYRRASCKTLLLKLGSRGLLAFRAVPKKEEDVRSFFALDSFSDAVVDAVGAGDALLAYSALSQWATGSAVTASVLGSLAAAVECEHLGNIPVGPDDLRVKLDHLDRLFRFQ